MNPENTNEQNYPRISLGITLIREKLAKTYPDLEHIEVMILDEELDGVVSWTIIKDDKISFSAEFEKWPFYQVLRALGVLLFLYALKERKQDMSQNIIPDVDKVVNDILSERCEHCGAQLKSSSAGFCFACGKPRTWDNGAESEDCTGGN